MGPGTCTAGGSDGSGVVVCGGASTTGRVAEAGGDVGVGKLVVGAGDTPLCGDDPGIELREDHGSRRRLAGSWRRPWWSGSKLVYFCLPDRDLENRLKIFGILGLAVCVFKEDVEILQIWHRCANNC